MPSNALAELKRIGICARQGRAQGCTRTFERLVSDIKAAHPRVLLFFALLGGDGTLVATIHSV
jgi:hypothetical protein